MDFMNILDIGVNAMLMDEKKLKYCTSILVEHWLSHRFIHTLILFLLYNSAVSFLLFRLTIFHRGL